MRFIEFKTALVEGTLSPKTFLTRKAVYYINLINLIQDGEPVAVTKGRIKKSVIFPLSVASQLKNIWNPKLPPTTPEEIKAFQEANNLTPDGKIDLKTKEKLAEMGLLSPPLATQDQVDLMKQLELIDSDGDVYSITNIEKTAEIKKEIGVKDGKEIRKKWWNKGNVAEGIMSAAVVAKFTLQGGKIDAENILEVVRDISTRKVPVLDKDNAPRMYKGVAIEQVEGVINGEAYGKKLLLKIILNPNDFRALLESANDEETFRTYDQSEEIYQLYKDCASYVNDSDNVTSALSKIENADSKDLITVSAEGATHESQSSTKADLFIRIAGTTERLLSIKTATVKHIGAKSGYQFDNLNEFFASTLGFGLPEEFRDLYEKPPPAKEIDDPEDTEEDEKKRRKIPNPDYDPAKHKMSQDDRSKAVERARTKNFSGIIKTSYQWIMEKLLKKLSGDSEDTEYNFVKTVAESVIQHATMGEDVRLVVISPSAKKAYTELDVKGKLHESLEEYDLVPSIELGENYKILIYGYPKTDLSRSLKNDKTLFVQLRTYPQESTIRNVVEMGGLLKQLTQVVKEKEETGEEDVIKVKDQPQEVPINIINAVIRRNQLPIQQKPQIIAQANELLKAGYNFNQIEQALVKQFAQDVVQPEPSQDVVQPEPSQDVVQPAFNQQKQRLGHLRQDPEEPVSEELSAILKNAGLLQGRIQN